MRNMPITSLGNFEEVSIPELHRNNDIPLSANYLGSATVVVGVDNPFKTQLFIATAANVDRVGDGSKKGDQACRAFHRYGRERV